MFQVPVGTTVAVALVIGPPQEVACTSNYSKDRTGFKGGRSDASASLAAIASLNSEATIRDLLSAPGTWAVVGCSPSPHRDSNRIAALLQRRGNRIVPVNPTADGHEILGEPCHGSLTALPAGAGVDVVDIFRRSDAAGAHVDEAIEIGARAVWMQLGVIDHAAAERAQAAGLDVVMDRCPAIEVRRLGLA
jgi:predicted CoA-binding protein